jgi:hypothetical protein
MVLESVLGDFDMETPEDQEETQISKTQIQKAVDKLISPQARTTYPGREEADGSFNQVSNYGPMIVAFGEIVLQVDDSDYQGDSRILYRRVGGQFGWLQFGWGSCSGCDALQGCDSYDDLQKLMDSTRESITWWDSAQEALDFFLKHDWEGDYSNGEVQQGFVASCITFLKSQITS